MANQNYSTACSIPNPKDVLEHPLSLFTNDVVACSALVNRVGKSNYQSYIAAIAKFASKQAPWSTETASQIERAANHLNCTMSGMKIVLPPGERKLMLSLCNARSINFSYFTENFENFKKSLVG